jgi:hypothetical protein
MSLQAMQLSAMFFFFKNAISPSQEVNAKGCIVFGGQKYHQ